MRLRRAFGVMRDASHYMIAGITGNRYAPCEAIDRSVTRALKIHYAVLCDDYQRR